MSSFENAFFLKKIIEVQQKHAQAFERHPSDRSMIWLNQQNHAQVIERHPAERSTIWLDQQKHAPVFARLPSERSMSWLIFAY